MDQAGAWPAAVGRRAAFGRNAGAGRRVPARPARSAEASISHRGIWLVLDLGGARAAGVCRYAHRAVPLRAGARLYQPGAGQQYCPADPEVRD